MITLLSLKNTKKDAVWPLHFGPQKAVHPHVEKGVGIQPPICQYLAQTEVSNYQKEDVLSKRGQNQRGVSGKTFSFDQNVSN